MNRNILLILCIIIITIANFDIVSSKQLTNQNCINHNLISTDGEFKDIEPIIEIKIPEHLSLDRHLRLHWKITNIGSTPIYVYSSFLEQEDRVLWLNINPQERIFDLQFTLLFPLNVYPYSFPSPKFLEIVPTQFQEGDIASNTKLGLMTSFTKERGKVKGNKILPGNWKIRCIVGYGYEIVSVKSKLKELYLAGRHNSHPINPIVAWQKALYSNFVNVNVTLH